MRFGQNPSKSGIQAFLPSSLGVALLTYIPSQDGYFTDVLDIFKIQLASLHQNTSEPFDLLVFDNGSCEAVQDGLRELQRQGQIDWLLLSTVNLGKTGALNWILSAMPNEWICYSDSDVFFRKGWNAACRELLETFPDAGVVTAQPSFFENLKEESVALQLLQAKGYRVSPTRPQPWIVKEYTVGLGADAAQEQGLLTREIPTVHDLEDTPRAYTGASHMQFLGKRERLQQILPLPAKFALSTDEDREFDTRIDRKGWLRLSTLTPYVVHMGNQIDESLLDEVAGSSLQAEIVKKTNRSAEYKNRFGWKLLVRLNHIGFMRRIFKRLYMNLFEYYSIEKK